MATILTLTANTLLDHAGEGVPEPNRTTRVVELAPVAGGKGLNVGRVLARHGHRVLCAGFSGGATGAQLCELVAADGMEPVFTPTAARTRVGFYLVGAAGTSAVLEGGFTVTPSEVGALVARVRSLLDGVELVVIGGSVPHNAANGLYRMVLDRCAEADVPCWVDSYGEAMDEALGGAHPPALVKPNKQEYGRSRKWLSATEMHITDAGAEVRVRSPAGRFRLVPPKVRELNPVGSGDCYLAALAHARLTGMAPIDQLKYAVAAGAANASRADVARIAPSDILALVDRVEVEPANA